MPAIKHPPPTQIGITGGIGVGKSTVCHLFQLLGTPVYDADSHAKSLMQSEPTLIQAITDLLGEKAYFQHQRLNTRYIAARIFHDPPLRKALEALVHPALEKQYASWSRTQHNPYILKEAALLFETGSYHNLDATVLVTAPTALCIQRVRNRDPQRTPQTIQRIIQQQWSEQKKKTLSTYTIINNEHSALIPQVLALHDSFQSTTPLTHSTPQAT